MSVPNSSRRSFFKWMAAAPLLTQIAVRELYAQAASVVGKDPRENVYTRLGVPTVINCRGTWTYLSGSRIPRGAPGPIAGGRVLCGHDRSAAGSRAQTVGVDWVRVRHGDLRFGRGHGGSHRWVYGGHR